MSLFAMAVSGMMPLGSLFIGMVSRYIGAPNALLCQGLMSFVLTVLFTRFLLSRRQAGRKKAHPCGDAP